MPEVMPVIVDPKARLADGGDLPGPGLPRGQDLPDSDGVPLDSEWVSDETRLYLIEPLRRHLARTGVDAFVGGNSWIYYQPHPVPPVGPDFYVVRGGRWRGQTKWVAWEEEGLLPTTIVEFLSPSTESEDRGRKFCIYRDVFRTEDYFLFDPLIMRLEGFHLEGAHYVSLAPDANGRMYSRSLGLHLGVQGDWLRLWTPQGDLLLSGEERAEAERARAEAERSRAEAERARAEAAESELERLRAELERLRGT